MFYIIRLNYSPNTAHANRLRSYYRVIDKLGIKTHIYYLMPGLNMEKLSEKYDNIDITYLWDENKKYNRLSKLLLFYKNLFYIGKIIKSGDIVYTYGVTKIIKHFIKAKGVKTYAELTEHPLVSRGGGPPIINLSSKSIIRICKQLDGLFVISNPLKEYFVSQGIDENKVHIINMTVDPKRFDHLNKETTERYIAYCGTASNNKDGVDKLIKAFSIVAAQIASVKLYIIGKTPSVNDEVGNLKLIESLGLKDRIVFTGIVSFLEIPQILKNAEVLALARPNSLQARCGFPTKLGEYLLTKNPVVCTKVGDIPIYLKDGESALLSDESSIEEFASKLIFALNNRTIAQEIGKRGADVAIEHFNCEIETKKMLKVIFGNKYFS